MSLFNFLINLKDFLLGWPLIIYVMLTALICTFALFFVQFRYFFKAWKFTIFPEKPSEKEIKEKHVDMTPFQAFVNALSTSLGNGSIAGMATAVYSGGPGAGFWVLVTGFLTMAIRYSEIFLSTYFRMQTKEPSAIGGPCFIYKIFLAKNIFLGSMLLDAFCTD